MENKKSSSGRRILNFVLFLCDAALLVWIIVSWRGQNRPQATADHYSSLGHDASGFTGESTGSSTGSADSFSTDSADHDSGPYGGADSWFFDEEPSSDEPQAVSEQTGGQSSVSYDTTARPEQTDFDVWKSHGGAVPTGAAVLTDFGAVLGSWKGFIQYDTAEELVSFTLSPSQSGADLTVDWYLIHYFGDGSWMNEEDMEDAVWSGSWSDGILTVSGAVGITFRAFYEIGGQQFAVGEMMLADGSSAVVGMVRP